ncbi:hypothetical protein [Vibrio parahaemolyticus]|uniref:hypothetical protein n=1 Tax=Vibrio parahaemolyticus TaxID=670 RepID=UPI0020BD7C8B|nr:hypothetical protein [Vibrio parahaemolyticus]
MPPITGSSLIEMPQALTASEQAGLDIAKRWINGTDKPIRSPDGAITYFFGKSLPSVVCAPLKTCDIQLEPGEQISKKRLKRRGYRALGGLPQPYPVKAVTPSRTFW